MSASTGDASTSTSPPRLARVLGTGHAVLLGLGSIVGTGVFVSLGLAVGVAGPAALAAVGLAGLLAAANGLSSAQLAASHPVSGGTYEYGYRFLSPWAGFTAGWMFLAAKSASAATAALGMAGYLASVWGAEAGGVVLAEAVVVLLTGVVLAGMRTSSRVNAGIVTVSLASLAVFVLAGLPRALAGSASLAPFLLPGHGRGPAAFLEATALLFVAYTGYGRIATLGEEVREPRRTIPRAIVATLGVSVLLYAAVTWVGVASVGPGAFAAASHGAAAPLAAVARSFALPAVPRIVAAGALAAMLGVLLNLILGLSRVLLAMGRRGDVPSLFGRLDRAGRAPAAAVVAVGALVAALTLLGDVETTWSLSAFTVLVYYALTNLAALRLPAEERLYPRWIAVAGLAGCLFLAFWIEPPVLLAGLGILAVGWGWRAVTRASAH